MLKVHSIESLGTYDGPGIRLVIFLQGCNFACSYCANPDTITLEGGKEMSIDDILGMAKNQRPFFGKEGGITVSGGEPLLQAHKLFPLFKKLKEHNFNTCIDSNGSIFNKKVEDLIEYTDLVLLDVKHIDNNQHLHITGRNNKNTLKFAEFLYKKSIPVWLRYVLIPDLTDQEEALHNLGKKLQGYSNIQKMEIQPYHKLGVHKYEHLKMEYKLKNIQENSKEQLERAYKIFTQYFNNTVIN